MSSIAHAKMDDVGLGRDARAAGIMSLGSDKILQISGNRKKTSQEGKMPFEHEAVRKLIDFKEEIEKLIEPLEKNTSDGREFRTNFKKLKERMQAEYKWSSIVRAQKNMDYIERDFYWPAIQGAWVAISFAKISGNPSSWLHPLYDAQFELNWHLSQLDK